jgi:Ca-activated chloride channel family protein
VSAQGAAGEVALRVPDEPGTFEVRYHLAPPEGGSQVIGRSPSFTSRAATATLDAPAEVGGGATFEVAWTGPDNLGDYLTIVPVGADEGAFRDYAYTVSGSPARLTAPLDAGAYELRYVTAQAGSTLVRRAIAVAAVTASVTAPAQVPAGAAFEVAWSGPDNASDYLTIVPAGAGEGEYGSYAYTGSGDPATLTAPIDAGAYEVRYVAGQDQSTLARAPVTVTTVGATVAAAAQVDAGGAFEVSWTGPDNPGDYLTIVPAGAAEGAYLDYAYTADGSPVALTAPDEAGRYEVRYVTGQGDRTLASTPVEVR